MAFWNKKPTREQYWNSEHGKEMLAMLDEMRQESNMTDKEYEETKENFYQVGISLS